MSLRVENLGGIRPSLDENRHLRHIAVLTASAQSGKVSHDNPYADRIEGDVLVYTAQGRVGDQTLTGRNKRLLDQYSWPAPYYGFTNIGNQTYEFLGLLVLIRHYQEAQVDVKGDLRHAWIFEFRIHRSPPRIPIDQAALIAAELIGARDPLVTTSDRDVADLPLISEPESNGLLRVEDLEATRAVLFSLNPYAFERLVARTLVLRGFRDVQVTQASGDGGIDVNAYVSNDDYFFANTHVQVQVKRWRHAVGSVEVNGFRGALSSTAKGVFITTSHFTKAAVSEAMHPVKPAISLLDGLRLSTMICALGFTMDDLTSQ